MAKQPTIAELVERFADEIVAQDKAADHVEGNKHATRCVAAFKLLTSMYGDPGREALASLFNHPWPRVRVVAAAFLLRYMHDKAMAVLRELAKRDDMVGFGASQTIKNWNEGLWELDSSPDDEHGHTTSNRGVG